MRALRSSQTVNFRASRTLRWTGNIQPGLLDLTPRTHPELFGDLRGSRRRFVVIDKTVNERYGEAILAQLDRYGVEHNKPLLIAGGEQAKSPEVVTQILEAMEAWRVARFDEPTLIWGGGSLHDVVGLACATYRRAVPYIVFGTTLVAAIDAMYALKVGINQLYKNRVGNYHPPLASWADPAFFASLDADHIREGVGEILKVGICMDGRLFRYLETDGRRAVHEKFQGSDRATLAILRHALAAMGPELSDNPYEHNPQRASYGGHDISTAMEPDVTHGVAVALNLQWATMVAWRRGHITPQRRNRILNLAAELDLPRWHPVLENVDRMAKALDDVARHRRGQHRAPAPARRLGRVVYLNNITRDELVQGLTDMRDFAP